MISRHLPRLRRSPFAHVGSALLALAALAALWYGAMVVLLALDVSPRTVNDISAHRTIVDYFTSIPVSAITPRVRLIAGLAGAATFAVAGVLAWKALPRPHRPRTDVVLDDAPGTHVVVQPRAIERAAESAALGNPGIASAGAFAGAHLRVGVAVTGADDTAATLRDVQQRILAALANHELPPQPVDVVLTGLRRPSGRELA